MPENIGRWSIENTFSKSAQKLKVQAKKRKKGHSKSLPRSGHHVANPTSNRRMRTRQRNSSSLAITTSIHHPRHAAFSCAPSRACGHRTLVFSATILRCIEFPPCALAILGAWLAPRSPHFALFLFQTPASCLSVLKH